MEAPICFRCFRDNDGTVVGCHSNSIYDGHGTAQKAHDLLAYMCNDCHKYVDTHWKQPGVQESFYRAVYESSVWLLSTGGLITRKSFYTEE